MGAPNPRFKCVRSTILYLTLLSRSECLRVPVIDTYLLWQSTTMPEPTDLKCIKLLLPRETALSGLAIGCRYDNPVTAVVSVVKFTYDNGLTVFKEFQVIVGDSEGRLPRTGYSVPSEASQTVSKGRGRGSGMTITKRECWSSTCIAQGNACIQLTCCCVVVLVVTN